MRQRFFRHIKKRFPFLVAQRILLAVSGGLDSMAMLQLFLEVREKVAIEMAVAHVNHHLRPSADRDAYFVDDFCQAHGIVSHMSEITGEITARPGGGIEDRVRRERYRLLTETAKRHGFSYIATAHQRNDQIETLLMRLFDRGTGLHGLAGIPEVSMRGRVTFVRPLLHYSRDELCAYMKGHRWMEDETNDDRLIRRNLYRHEIIPYLRRMAGSSLDEHLAGTAAEAALRREVLEKALEYFWERHRDPDHAMAYIVERTEVSFFGDAFWHAALAHLFRQVRGYAYGKRTIHDINEFMKNSTSGECRCGPLRCRSDHRRIAMFLT